jgi:hypothetical protein
MLSSVNDVPELQVYKKRMQRMMQHSESLANKSLTGKQNEWQGKHEHMRPDQSQISFQACTRRVTPPSLFFELLLCLKRRNATAAMMTKATPAMLIPAEEIDQ